MTGRLKDAVEPTLPDATRHAPIDMSADVFRKLGHELVDSLAQLFDTMHERRVAPGLTPSAIRARMGNGGLPETGEDPQQILSSAAQLLMDTSTFNGHPKFMGYITASAAP